MIYARSPYVPKMPPSTDFENKKVLGVITAEQQQARHSIQDTRDQEKQDAVSTTDAQLPPPPDGGLHAWLKVF